MAEFINYAHRGASQYAPENTLVSFYMGWQMGASGIETDIQCTKDGIPVLFHDDDMMRIAGMNCSIKDLTYDELRQVDAGIHKGAQYRGERIPSLEEFLHHFACKDLNLALEIKSLNIEDRIIPLVKKYCNLEQVIMTSSKWDALVAFHKLMPEIRIGYLSRTSSDDLLKAMLEEGMYQYCPQAQNWTLEWNSKFREAGFSVRAWGISNEELMHKMLDMHVDGMTVNFPDILQKALRK